MSHHHVFHGCDIGWGSRYSSASDSDSDVSLDGWEGLPSRPPAGTFRDVKPQDRDVPHLALTQHLLAYLLAMLPVDTRLRAREVCPGWRDVLDSDLARACWKTVDVSVQAGLSTCATESLLIAACRQADFRVEYISVSGSPLCSTLEVLKRAVAANADTLIELVTLGDGMEEGVNAIRLHKPELLSGHRSFTFFPLFSMLGHDLAPVRALARKGLKLERLHCDVRASGRAAGRLLQWEGRPLCVRKLTCQGFPWCRRGGESEEGSDEEFDLAATTALGQIARGVLEHPSLQDLDLTYASVKEPTSLKAFGQLVDALVARPHVHSLRLSGCTLTSAALPQLSRLLLEAGHLQTLALNMRANGEDSDGSDAEEAPQLIFADSATTAAFAAALRASQLSKLKLDATHLFRPPQAGLAILQALVAMPLRSLDISQNTLPAATLQADVGAALAALLRPDGLTHLSCESCNLGDVGMAPITSALGRPTALTSLRCHSNGMSARFACEKLAPAVNASTLETALLMDDDDFDRESKRSKEKAKVAEAAWRALHAATMALRKR